jgi:hypothetical protein
MDRAEIELRLKMRPFEPFTIHTDDGDLVGVKSPEFAWLPPFSNRLHVAIEMGDSGATRIISLDHIAALTVGPGVDTKFE